jgi:hypothetical protein
MTTSPPAFAGDGSIALISSGRPASSSVPVWFHPCGNHTRTPAGVASMIAGLAYIFPGNGPVSSVVHQSLVGSGRPFSSGSTQGTMRMVFWPSPSMTLASAGA